MSNFEFKKAQVSNRRLRLAILGPAGSGKTYTSLLLAKGIGQPIALIDTEHGSAEMYASEFEFSTLKLKDFHPNNYIEAIASAVKGGFKTIVVDSLSHAWTGKGGALELVDQETSRGKGNSFTAWRNVTPLHNRLIDSIVGAGAHIICTMRTKTDYVMDKDKNGSTQIKKVGLAAIQRDGMEYEFDFVGELDVDHKLAVTKSRIKSLADKVFTKPGAELANEFKNFLQAGEAAGLVAEAMEVLDATIMISGSQMAQILSLIDQLNLGQDYLPKVYGHYQVEALKDLTAAQGAKVLTSLQAKVSV